jgi:DNA modification methylase
MKEIDFALVEETRPPIYRAMKYWGKKPHNIWSEYIKNYTPDNGIFLDPFTGSGISLFESFKLGRKSIGFDLNPLTTFLIEVTFSNFNFLEFKEEFNKIKKEIIEDSVYKEFFSTTCPKCRNLAIAQHFKDEDNLIYEIGVDCNCQKKLFIKIPDNRDQDIKTQSNKINIKNWYPDQKFPESQSFTENFKKKLNGNFSNIWSKRNLYIISEIFEKIKKQKNDNLKKQLLFGFIQTIHLCTKMSVPRKEKSKRPFSTSWGRSAYLLSSRQMEMNPIYLFESSCLGKQSVKSCLESASTYFEKKPKMIEVNSGNKNINNNSFDIKYGLVDILNITDYIKENSIDFIMTDPPYGGLVKYFDLSLIWLCWLSNIDKKYYPDFKSEITINSAYSNLETYKKRFLKSVQNLTKILKHDGKIVFTFHNKELEIWNAFLKTLFLSGLKIEKVIHQENKRSGESNVSMPYGTSAADFYIRCIKGNSKKLNKSSDFEDFVINKAIEIISERNEPTPYQFLLNGLLAEISQVGFDLDNFDKNIQQVLEKKINTIFILTDNNLNKAGNYWWFKDSKEYIKYPDKKLSDRVEDTIVSLLRRKISIKLDEAIAEIYIKYPNGLTPDTRSIKNVIEKFATKSGGKFHYRAEDLEKDYTDHTETLFKLVTLGKKLKVKTFIGKREQSENFKKKKLFNYADFTDLNFLKGFDKRAIKRIEMIDMLWIKENDNIIASFEVENSTNFISGIQRGSNLNIEIPKIMLMPDKRKKEFNNNTDPLFKDQFNKFNWTYMYYSDLDKILLEDKINLNDFVLATKKI